MRYGSIGLAAFCVVFMGLGGAGSAEDGNTLNSPEMFTGIANAEARSQALFVEMGKVLQSPRCMNCHPSKNTPTQGDDMHPHVPPLVRGAADFGPPGMACSTCHGAANVTFASGEKSIPGHDPWKLAPASMSWNGLSLKELCARIKDPERNGHRDLAALYDHMANDRLVGWAWHPGVGRKAAPGSQKLFGSLIRAWIDTGAACPE